MNNYTTLLIICLVAAGLLGVSAILNFTDNSVIAGSLLALGSALFAVAGFVVHSKSRGQRTANT